MRKPQNKNEIDLWLKVRGVQHYTIEDDLTVNVAGDVVLNNRGLTEIPVQFGVVSGWFVCQENLLTSLKGAPHEVGTRFICDHNQLISLKHAPKTIQGNHPTDFSMFSFLYNHIDIQDFLRYSFTMPEACELMFNLDTQCDTFFLQYAQERNLIDYEQDKQRIYITWGELKGYLDKKELHDKLARGLNKNNKASNKLKL